MAVGARRKLAKLSRSDTDDRRTHMLQYTHAHTRKQSW